MVFDLDPRQVRDLECLAQDRASYESALELAEKMVLRFPDEQAVKELELMMMGALEKEDWKEYDRLVCAKAIISWSLKNEQAASNLAVIAPSVCNL